MRPGAWDWTWQGEIVDRPDGRYATRDEAVAALAAHRQAQDDYAEVQSILAEGRPV